MNGLTIAQQYRALTLLRCLAEIGKAFDNDGLDEARPDWGDTRVKAATVGLLSGRGGKELLTLGQCFAAQDFLAQLDQQQPHLSKNQGDFEREATKENPEAWRRD